MPLTSDEAVEIVKRHGLELRDATALRSLADDPDTADQLAAKFSAQADPNKVAAKVAERRKGRA